MFSSHSPLLHLAPRPHLSNRISLFSFIYFFLLHLHNTKIVFCNTCLWHFSLLSHRIKFFVITKPHLSFYSYLRQHSTLVKLRNVNFVLHDLIEHTFLYRHITDYNFYNSVVQPMARRLILSGPCPSYQENNELTVKKKIIYGTLLGSINF